MINKHFNLKDKEKLVELIKENKTITYDNAKIRHFLSYYNDCEVFLVSRKISYVPEKNLGVYLASKYLGSPSYNPLSHHRFISFPLDLGHLGSRLSVNSCKYDDIFPHQKESRYFNKHIQESELLESNQDELLITYIESEKLPFLKEIYSDINSNLCYFVIIHGVMSFESFNTHVRDCSESLDDPYNVYLSDAIYSELIPIKEYMSKYHHRMCSSNHFVNGISYTKFTRMAFLQMFKILHSFAESELFSPFKNKGKYFSVYTVLNNEYGSKVRKNGGLFLYESMPFRILIPSEKSDILIEYIFEVSKKKYKLSNITSIQVPDLTNDDEVLNFIEHLKFIPTYGYGIRYIMNNILKYKNINDDKESPCIYLDLDDILNFFMYEYEVNDVFDWKCTDLICVVKDILEKTSNVGKIDYKTFINEFNILIENINLVENNPIGNVNQKEILRLLPFMYLFCFCLFKLTGKDSSRLQHHLNTIYPLMYFKSNGEVDSYNFILDNYLSGEDYNLPILNGVENYNYKLMSGLSREGSVKMSENFGISFDEHAEFNPMREPENNLSFDFSFDEFVESEEPKMTLDALVEQLKEDNGIEVFEKDSVKQKVLEDICSRGSGYNLRQVSGLIDSGLFTEEDFLLYFREKLKIEMEDNNFIFELLEFYTQV